jgi:hypothetical protein
VCRGRAVPRTFARTIARPPTECEARDSSAPASSVLQRGHRVTPEDTLPARKSTHAVIRALDVTVFIAASACPIHRPRVSTSASFAPAITPPLCISGAVHEPSRGMHFRSRSTRTTSASAPRTPGAHGDTGTCNRLILQAVARISRGQERPRILAALAARRYAATSRSCDRTSPSSVRTSGSRVCTSRSMLCISTCPDTPHTAV